MADEEPRDADAVVLRDPRDIRALAHPARLAVVTALYDRSIALTATQAARIAGVSPSAMSFHLRALERAGIVKRAPASEDGRERPWVRAGSELMVDLRESGGLASATATSALVSSVMEQDRRTFAETLARRKDAELERPLDAATAYNRQVLMVTPEEAREVVARITELLEPYSRDERSDAPQDAGLLTLSILTLPVDETP